MVKTQIQIEDWQHEAIKRESARASRSMSDFIREAVTEALKKGKIRRPLVEIAGKYTPLKKDDLKAHDAAWAESIR
ncbi:MAG: ribbon-helix-helix protein, CopG family [Blastochloris sp.]|nr:ribbon-helix-helix protein, CopG family [Blastochloris sp.]